VPPALTGLSPPGTGGAGLGVSGRF